MKEAVTKVIDTLTQEDFHGALEKLLEQYNKCIVAGGAYFEGDCATLHLILTLLCWVLSNDAPCTISFESLVCLDLELNRGLSGHWRTL